MLGRAGKASKAKARRVELATPSTSGTDDGETVEFALAAPLLVGAEGVRLVVRRPRRVLQTSAFKNGASGVLAETTLTADARAGEHVLDGGVRFRVSEAPSDATATATNAATA